MHTPEQMPLLSAGEGVPPEPKGFRVLFNLLREVGTLSVIEDWLKARGLTYSSGSWDELEVKRLRPYLAAGRLAMDDLMTLLAEIEEYGSAHVFLYHAPKAKAAALLDRERVRGIARELGLEAAWGMGRVLARPETPAISSIRLEDDPRGPVLVIKIVQQRREKRYLGEAFEGNRVHRTWELIPVRAVSVVRLFAFGLLEIRTTSHWYSTKYEDDVDAIRDAVAAWVPRELFSEFSLQAAKTALWDRRHRLKERIRFSAQSIRTDIGGRVDAVGGDEDGDMMDDAGVAAGVDAVMRREGAYCESSNVYWLAQPDGDLPGRDTHVVLSGQRHEFAITAGTSKRDYEWVFDQLRALA